MPKKGLSLKALNSKINRVSKRDKPETKVNFVNTWQVTMPITGSTNSIVAIGQGSTSGNRIGLETKAQGVTMRYNIQRNSSATLSLARVILVVDRQQIPDTAPSLADVVQDPSYLTSLPSHVEKGRFRILYDRIHCLTGSNDKQQGYINKKLNFNVNYNGVSAGNYQKNGIYLMLQSDQSVYVPLISYSLRYDYTDA